MPTTRIYNGPGCPDCGSDKIRKDPYNDVEKRYCFDCSATWRHVPEDAEGGKGSVKRRSSREFRGAR